MTTIVEKNKGIYETYHEGDESISRNKNVNTCNICFFTAKNKYIYKKHLLTKKHMNMQLCPEIYRETCCKCNKKFKSKNSLILHFFKCSEEAESPSSPAKIESTSIIQKNSISQSLEKSSNLKKEFLSIFENINKNIELYNMIKTKSR